VKLKIEFVFYIVLILFALGWVLRAISDFRPVRRYIEVKMGKYGVMINMTLEDAERVGLDNIDTAQNHGLNRHSTVEELLDKIIK